MRLIFIFAISLFIYSKVSESSHEEIGPKSAELKVQKLEVEKAELLRKYKSNQILLFDISVIHISIEIRYFYTNISNFSATSRLLQQQGVLCDGEENNVGKASVTETEVRKLQDEVNTLKKKNAGMFKDS